jgi:DNA-binding NtrC family response regulator
MAAARVLVVDDDQPFRYAISKTLGMHGYAVLSAEGPFQALEIVRNTPSIRVVLSDLEMPGMRGAVLVGEIAEKLPQAACILMTGGAVDSATVPADVPLLHKPFLTADLIAAVERAIGYSAELSTKLRATIEWAAELQRQSRQVRSDCQDVISKSAETRRNARLLTGRERSSQSEPNCEE